MSLPPPPPPSGFRPPPPTGPYPPNYPYNVPFGAPAHPGGQHAGGWQQQTPSAKRSVRRGLAIAAVVMAALAALGSVLPWARATSDFGTVSNNGLDVDGKITIVLALAVGGMFILSIVRGTVWPAIAGIPLFALIALIGVIDVADVNNQGDQISDFGVDFQVGVGLWLVLAAGLAGTILSIIALTTRTRP